VIHKHVSVVSVASAQKNVVPRVAASRHDFIPPLWGRYTIYSKEFNNAKIL